MTEPTSSAADSSAQLETVTLGGGCFWCVEAVYKELAGVVEVASGYAGGHVENPTYQQVCTKQTGHVEVVQIRYDPAVIPFESILEVFFRSHDPTTPDRQGNDVGPQYRSVIFFHTPQQERIAREVVDQLNASGLFPAPVCTEIAPAPRFYPAESYHQDYFAFHGSEPYCQLVVRPKVEKVRQLFSDRLKKS